MDATLIVIDSDAELGGARALVDRLWDSENPPVPETAYAQTGLVGPGIARALC